MDIKKAGIIPYIFTDRGLEMLFMVSSDPAFGGPDPMIAKGHVDDGETPFEAACREGHEEVGLKPSNCLGSAFRIGHARICGKHDEYLMEVFAVEVHTKEDFDIPHFETEYTVWLTLEEFAEKGRRSHLEFVTRLAKLHLN